MRIVCVAGGSYKSFYLNHFLKINKCDLIVFNFGIFYNIRRSAVNNSKLIFEEIRHLAKCKNCAVVAGVIVDNNRYFAICQNNKLKIYSSKQQFKLKLADKEFLITQKRVNSFVKNKIIFTDNNNCVNVKACSLSKNYIFIYSRGVDVVVDKKRKRNFCKCSKFILK